MPITVGKEQDKARNSSMRRRLRGLVDPIVNKLAEVPGIKANHITISGSLLVALGGLEKLINSSSASPWIALGLIGLGMSLDSLDGALARKLKQSSDAGAILDLLNDRTQETALALVRVIEASNRGDALGVLAAALVGLTNPLPSFLRAEVEANGGVVPEAGKNPFDFLGTRMGRVLLGTIATAFPTAFNIEGCSFQSIGDMTTAFANLSISYKRFEAWRQIKNTYDGKETDLTVLGSEKAEKLKPFIAVNIVAFMAAGILGITNIIFKRN